MFICSSVGHTTHSFSHPKSEAAATDMQWRRLGKFFERQATTEVYFFFASDR